MMKLNKRNIAIILILLTYLTSMCFILQDDTVRLLLILAVCLVKDLGVLAVIYSDKKIKEHYL